MYGVKGNTGFNPEAGKSITGILALADVRHRRKFGILMPDAPVRETVLGGDVMAVYLPPKQNNLSTLGIIDLLGKYLVNPMMERSADARKVEQARQLESDKEHISRV